MISKIKIFIFSIILSLSVLLPFASAQAEEKAAGPVMSPIMATEKVRVVYFYANDCPNCAKIKPFLNGVKEKYKDKIDFFEHDVKEKEEYRQLFFKFIEVYNLPGSSAKVPLIFIDNDYLLGVKDIEANLEAKINEKLAKKEALDLDCRKFLEDWEKNGGSGSTNTGDGSGACSIVPGDDSCSIGDPAGDNGNSKNKTISIGLIVTTATIDSINPCAIAVLLFLIAVLISLKATRKRMLAVGLVYIFGVFISYYLAGIGLLGVISRFDIAREVNLFAGIVVIVAAFISVKEGLYPDSKQILVIPEKTKGIFMNLMRKGTFPAVFMAGILVSAFELPCTGQVYLSILSLLSQESMKAQGYLYLLIYNVIFVLPLVLILFAAAWGLDIKRLQSFRKDSRGTIKILIGVIMFVLGAWLIYTTSY